MPSIAAALADYPDYNNKERTRIGTIAACAERLRSLNPDSPRVIKRIEAYEWVLEALKTVDDQPEVVDELFFVIRDRRNDLEDLPDEEMDGYLGRELRSVDWAMEELIPGSGHIANRKLVVPWLVINTTRSREDVLDSAVVLAETEVEAIDLVKATRRIYYPDRTGRAVEVDGQNLEATKLAYRKGILYHNNTY